MKLSAENIIIELVKKIILFATGAVVVGIVCWFIGVRVLNTQNSGRTHVIALTEEGFVPTQITIKKGDTIEFKTMLGKPFWPASNLHPTHGIFPEFDPKRELQPNETWSFQFNKTGQWGFHDHISFYYTGKITVTR